MADDTLAQRLQQQCVDWGAYWRASDAHGVELTPEQALELLRTALGVEVDIKPAPNGCKRIECLGRARCGSCLAMAPAEGRLRAGISELIRARMGAEAIRERLQSLLAPGG